ncbi:MAG: hypothetical protein JST12_07135 [Armatimonadetes bacterium]|nr:hypothetical protein [Armatimonadota bacterium]
MRQDGGELNYLAGTQLEINPDSFSEVVKEAFLLEHGTRQNQDIAKVLGVDKSRVTQLFSAPQKLKPESIEHLISHLKKKEHRKRIVRAWVKECFGEDISDLKIGPLTGEQITDKTVKRIDRMVRQSRLRLAAFMAEEAYRKTDDRVLQEKLLDRAQFAYQRLDEPGHAMTVVRTIAFRARRDGDTYRLIAAHLLRARILSGIFSVRPEEIEAIFSDVRDLLEQVGAKPPPRSPYLLGSQRMLLGLERGTKVLFMERGTGPIDTDYLRTTLHSLAQETSSSSQRQRFSSYQLAARIHILLGEYFQAEEALEKSFESGELKNLNTYEMSGLVHGMILAAKGSTDEAIKYLRGVSATCRKSADHYHLRLVEAQVARLENSLF